ncbi:MAG: Gfo/Idh/MocA family oxidoreductase [Acidobacteriota bacterium]
MSTRPGIHRRTLYGVTLLLILGTLPLLVPIRTTRAQQGASPAKFRLAIVGVIHSHAWGHLRNIAKMEGIELVGISDQVAALREEAGKAAPGIPIYDDYRKLLDEKKPEAVWAFVENDRHLEITKACATRGIHLMFEKPMAATYDQAKEMLALARKHDIKLMINYQMAWWPENYSGYDVAQSGKLGKVWRVRTIIGHGGPAPRNASDVRGQNFWTWLNDESRGGGALMDFTCYGGVWWRWYLGLPKTVFAVTTHTRPDVYKTNTSATVLGTFADNGVGIIEGSWDLPRSFQDVEVFGDKGSVSVSRNRVEIFIGNQREETKLGALAEDRREPVSYFVGRIRTKQPIDGMVSPEFNVDVMQIVEAARRSVKSGRPVSLPLP